MNESAEHVDPYGAIAALYDLEHESFSDDIPFYLNSVEAVGDPVLEMACGSGRVTLAVARAGYRVTGVDLSAPMLARATEKIGDLEVRHVTLHRAPMEMLAGIPGGPFGVVIMALDALLHVSNPDGQRRALTEARRVLDPRGQLLIDVFNPAPEHLIGFDDRVRLEGTWVEPQGKRVAKFSSRRLDASRQLIDTTLWYDLASPTGAIERVSTQFDLRYVHRHELELMLELAGFRSWQIYGGYEMEPYEEHAERLIVAAEVT